MQKATARMSFDDQVDLLFDKFLSCTNLETLIPFVQDFLLECRYVEGILKNPGNIRRTSKCKTH